MWSEKWKANIGYPFGDWAESKYKWIIENHDELSNHDQMQENKPLFENSQVFIPRKY